MFARSASKPLQALGSVRAGVLERFGLDTRHPALACASHGGSAAHVAVVAEVLEACGLSRTRSACGPELPLDPREARGARPRRIRHNCSGKHAFGLARCLAEGWPLDGYFRAGHPLQGAMRDCVAEACGVAPERGGDRRLRDAHVRAPAAPRSPRAFGRLAGGGLGPSGDRCAAAMRAHPELVAYDGAIDTELMRARGRAVAKIGAEGVLAIGLPDGRGLALKVATARTARWRPPASRWSAPSWGSPRRCPRPRRRADPELARHPRGRAARRADAWSPAKQPVLQRALDGRVERVQAVQRERLGRAEPAAGRGVGPVVAEHAVQEREPALRRERRQRAARAAAGRARGGRAAGPRRTARSPRRR